MDFKLSNVKGEDRLTMMYPVEGLGYIYDNRYELVEKVPVGETGVTLNMHEFNFVENGKTLLLLKRNTTHATKEMSAKTGYDGECFLTFDGFEEVDTENWETKFAWNTWDHVGLDESSMDAGPPEGRCGGGGAWDYIHTNALDKFTDGHYLLSGRHTDTIYKISKDDGSIIWRLGGRKSDFEMGAANFSRQHHARFLSQNETHTIISVFDNAKGADVQKPSSPNSRGLIIAINNVTMTTELVKAVDHPEGPGHYAYRRGNFQILSNNNSFLCWSEQSLQSEHKPDGTLIMEARMLPDWIGTYRGFKYDFKGLPKQPPDVLSLTESKGPVHNFTRTMVHVSWNGATEVKNWVFYKSTADGTTQVRIGAEKRSGFETSFNWEGYASYVVVEGIDKTGNSLGASTVIRSKEPENVYSDDVRAEMQWLQDAAAGKIHPLAKPRIHIENFFAEPRNWALGFLAGFALSPVLFFIMLKIRQRRSKAFWWRKKPTGLFINDRHAEEYDETKLDDLSSDSHRKDSDSEQYRLTDDEEDEQGDAEYGRLSARTPYARVSSAQGV